MMKNKEAKQQDLRDEATREEVKAPIAEEIAQEEKDLVREANQVAQEMKELAQRVQAEFDNYRKRNNESVKTARADGENAVLFNLFQVTDNFERAIAQVDEKSREGVSLIFKQIVGIMEKFLVEEIAAQGAVFNPNEHNAVMTIDDAENEGKVVDVLQKGYKRDHKVLRAAMVKVAK